MFSVKDVTLSSVKDALKKAKSFALGKVTIEYVHPRKSLVAYIHLQGKEMEYRNLRLYVKEKPTHVLFWVGLPTQKIWNTYSVLPGYEALHNHRMLVHKLVERALQALLESHLAGVS